MRFEKDCILNAWYEKGPLTIAGKALCLHNTTNASKQFFSKRTFNPCSVKRVLYKTLVLRTLLDVR